MIEKFYNMLNSNRNDQSVGTYILERSDTKQGESIIEFLEGFEIKKHPLSGYEYFYKFFGDRIVRLSVENGLLYKERVIYDSKLNSFEIDGCYASNDTISFKWWFEMIDYKKEKEGFNSLIKAIEDMQTVAIKMDKECQGLDRFLWGMFYLSLEQSKEGYIKTYNLNRLHQR